MINNKMDMGAEGEWKGPSKVVAINGKKLFIDNGARLATVNRDDSFRIGQEFWRMDDLPDHTTQNKDSNMKKKKRKEKRKEKRKGSLSQKETRQCHRMKLRSKVTQNVGSRCRGTRRMQEESNYDVDSNDNEEEEGEALRENNG